MVHVLSDMSRLSGGTLSSAIYYSPYCWGLFTTTASVKIANFYGHNLCEPQPGPLSLHLGLSHMNIVKLELCFYCRIFSSFEQLSEYVLYDSDDAGTPGAPGGPIKYISIGKKLNKYTTKAKDYNYKLTVVLLFAIL